MPGRGLRAVNEARTRDPQLGKLMLYQLSYYRNSVQMYKILFSQNNFSSFFPIYFIRHDTDKWRKTS